VSEPGARILELATFREHVYLPKTWSLTCEWNAHHPSQGCCSIACSEHQSCRRNKNIPTPIVKVTAIVIQNNGEEDSWFTVLWPWKCILAPIDWAGFKVKASTALAQIDASAARHNPSCACSVAHLQHA